MISSLYSNSFLGLLTRNPLLFLLLFPGLLMAITVHEFSHAFVADKLGDPTPRYQGRVTLDPRAHLDPIGVVAMLLTNFGWGKPVMYDPYNLQKPIRDTALIAMAGPISNIIVATLISFSVHFIAMPNLIAEGLVYIMMMNVTLALFNLIPIHPLDGGKVILSLLPKATAYEYEEVMRRYGLLILIFLILPTVNGVAPVSLLISPAIRFVAKLLLF